MFNAMPPAAGGSMPAEPDDLAAANLRHRAELQLARLGPPPPLGDADALRLLHELQVHQIELEMQNEALALAEGRARRSADALAATNIRLEREVLARTEMLAEACAAAEAANAAKSRFLSMMSHELRTPLTGVLGMLHLVDRQTTDHQQKEWLDKARQSAMHLLALVNDVLDFSKIEAGHMALAPGPLQLAEVLSALTDMLTPLAADKTLGVWATLDPALEGRWLQGDRTRLLQVLLNLAGNAVKFTHAGSVQVRLQLAEATDSGVLLRGEVTDTGIGIAPAAQARLFRAFEQLDTGHDRRHGGTGLGLAISRELVALMGGEIGVASQPGVGSCFWFTARLGLAEPPAAASTPAPAKP
jgi:signal transduction histidine kinase